MLDFENVLRSVTKYRRVMLIKVYDIIIRFTIDIYTFMCDILSTTLPWFNGYRLYNNNNDGIPAFFIWEWNPINEQWLLYTS